jgi:hypothetical protein
MWVCCLLPPFTVLPINSRSNFMLSHLVFCDGFRLRRYPSVFFSKTSFEATSVVSTKVQTGFIPVSTPEGTAIDLIRYARAIGGLDRVLTVIKELGESMDQTRFVSVVETNKNLAHGQRLGWLLERVGHSALAEDLHHCTSGGKGVTSSICGWGLRKVKRMPNVLLKSFASTWRMRAILSLAGSMSRSFETK